MTTRSQVLLLISVRGGLFYSPNINTMTNQKRHVHVTLLTIIIIDRNHRMYSIHIIHVQDGVEV